jgi:hypothetical protein
VRRAVVQPLSVVAPRSCRRSSLLCAMVHVTTRFLHKIEVAVLGELTRRFTSILDDCAVLEAVTPFVQDLGVSHGDSKVASTSFLGQI